MRSPCANRSLERDFIEVVEARLAVDSVAMAAATAVASEETLRFLLKVPSVAVQMGQMRTTSVPQPLQHVSTHAKGCVDASAVTGTKKDPLSSEDNEAEGKRVRGIEPPPEAWEASVLPLNHTRLNRTQPDGGIMVVSRACATIAPASCFRTR